MLRHHPISSIEALRKMRPLGMAILVFFASFACSILAVSGWAQANYGSALVTGALLRGESLVIRPESFDAGALPAGEERFVNMQVFNLTGRPIEIFGFGGYCGRSGCLSSDIEYPVAVAARGSLTIPIRYSGPKDRSDSFRLEAELYTAAGSREIVIRGRTELTASIASGDDATQDRPRRIR